MAHKIRLGLIGLSPGNGHPYSWAALCNGYNREAMENCGFPVIPQYLEKYHFPNDFINNAHVTHIWTQDSGLSSQIAFASNIESIVDDFRDLIGQVDGVLLARDDADMHLHYSRPFLEAGIPIYVDKPLALTLENAKRLIDLQAYEGQLFSCSALRYAQELMLSSSQLKSLGAIKCVMGFSPKDWDKYAIHIIEPMLGLFPEVSSDIKELSRRVSSNRIVLHGECHSGLEFEITTMGKCTLPISLKIVGEDNFIDLTFNNTFDAFKNALQTFIDFTCRKVEAISTKEMLASIALVEAGRA